MKPSTDLCHTCNVYGHSLTNSGNLTEEEKTEVLAKYQNHIEKVKMQRDHYRKQCEYAKTNFSSLDVENKIRGQRPCTVKTELHYCFDYAQQVHYPHYCQQVGPLFFKTPRKCQCFGVCSEGTQMFYLVDEAQHSNKGANTVTSMLHHHFEYLGYGETGVKLHMDNCSGQNKNNTEIEYGMWPTLIGLHDSVEYSLMEAGHMKFNPDWHFGLWKVKWRHTSVETLQEMADSVTRSSKNGHNISQLVDDDKKPVVFYDWASFLKKMFKPIPQLKSYHHFRIEKNHPGIVFVRDYMSSDEIAINIMKSGTMQNLQLAQLPTVIPQKGLDTQRQWYLYQHMAPYCQNKEVCPKPSVPKPIIKMDTK